MVSPPPAAAIAAPAGPKAAHATASASLPRHRDGCVPATLLPVPGITVSAIPLSMRWIWPARPGRGRSAWRLDDRLRSAARPGARARACGRLTAEGLLRVARLPEGAGRFRAHHHAAAGRRLRAG